jgi:outer membrane protein OmpA-like peptidoglycan-associated protein
MMKTACLTLASLLAVCLLFVSSAWATDCDRSVELYNQGTETAELAQKERLFKEALALPCRQQPVLAKIHNNLADTYEQQGRLTEAMAEYRQAIALDPTLPTPPIGLGDILHEQGQGDAGEVNHERAFLLAHYRSKDEIIHALSLTRAIRLVPSVNLYFGFAEAVLTPEGERQLEALREALTAEELRAYRFRLAGHTDNIGSTAYNQSLSERRAARVRRWLLDHGIHKDRLSSVGFGEAKPISDNSTDEGRRVNRRVEIRTVAVALPRERSASLRGMASLTEGERLLTEERYQEAIPHLEQALTVFEREDSTDGTEVALGDLILAYRFLGDYEKAGEHSNRLTRTE